MSLSVHEAASMLGVSAETVCRWARQGLLGARPAGGELSFDQRELERWARAQGLALRPLRPPAGPPAPPPLTSALRRGCVLRGLAGATPAEVLESLAAAVPLPEAAARVELLDQLRQREQLFSTALGHGIALPHPRAPSMAFCSEPVVVIGFPACPVPWGAVDGEPVHALFLVLSPTPQQHLQLLSRIAYMLRLPSFCDLLARQAPDAEILRVVAEREPALS